jgi:hypothetical protein
LFLQIDVTSTLGSGQQVEWTCSPPTGNELTYFPNIPIDNSSLTESVRDSPYLASAYIYPFQPMVNNSCNGKTLVEFCFTTKLKDVRNVWMNIILLRRLATDTGPTSTSISGTVLNRIDINTTVKCTNDSVCCHSERINASLLAEMNAFGVIFPDQTLLEYNDSQYQVQTFVASDIEFLDLTSNGQMMFEATGFTTNLNLRFLRFIVTAQPFFASDSDTVTINKTVVTVLSLIFVVTFLTTGILSAVTIVRCMNHQRQKEMRERAMVIVSLNQLATSQENLSNGKCKTVSVISAILDATIFEINNRW